MKIALACDHGGLNLKREIIAYLEAGGYEYEDFGTNSSESCDYPDYALPAAEAVASGKCDRGIVVCSTGIGVSIVANKVPGIRCAHCHDTYCAEFTRLHNNSNMLALGEKVVGVGYDQLIHDVALQQLHVVLGVDRAGLVGADGETHHGCFDALFLSEIPGFTVLCPASFAELRKMVRQALFEIAGPVAVRYPRGGEGAYREDRSGQPVVRLREGADAAILTYGVLVNQALEAADLLAERGIQAEVLKLNQISPLEYETLAPWLSGKRMLAVSEDAFGAGCVGQRVAAILAQHGAAPEKLILINLGKAFLPEGTVPQLQHKAGIDAEGIARAVWEAST